ncbi:MAG: molecular chaperone TorD family protein [Planctomycetota bacterium]
MSDTEGRRLAAAARLLGFLLQRELDEDAVAELRRGGVEPALEALGLALPPEGDTAALEALAAEYFERFVAPRDTPPLVHSLAEGGGYEGEPAAGVRNVAAQLGVARDEDAARGAPVDHLGSELELWAEVRLRAPDQASDFARAYLAWSAPILRQQSGHGGFYGRLSGVVAEFVETVSAPD